MKKLTTILCAALLAACASAQVPFKWMVETSRPSLQKITVLRGETVALTPKLCSYNNPIDLTGQTVKLWFQTNGMAESWWSAPGSLSSTTGEVVVNFGPEQDIGASEYNFYVECRAPSGVRNYRAYGTLAMSYAPGFSPSVLSSSAYPILTDQITERILTNEVFASTISFHSHTNDGVKHITIIERDNWNAKVSGVDFFAHTNDAVAHITAPERAAWNATGETLTTHLSSHTSDRLYSSPSVFWAVEGKTNLVVYETVPVNVYGWRVTETDGAAADYPLNCVLPYSSGGIHPDSGEYYAVYTDGMAGRELSWNSSGWYPVWTLYVTGSDMGYVETWYPVDATTMTFDAFMLNWETYEYYGHLVLTKELTDSYTATNEVSRVIIPESGIGEMATKADVGTGVTTSKEYADAVASNFAPYTNTAWLGLSSSTFYGDWRTTNDVGFSGFLTTIPTVNPVNAGATYGDILGGYFYKARYNFPNSGLYSVLSLNHTYYEGSTTPKPTFDYNLSVYSSLGVLKANFPKIITPRGGHHWVTNSFDKVGIVAGDYLVVSAYIASVGVQHARIMASTGQFTDSVRSVLQMEYIPLPYTYFNGGVSYVGDRISIGPVIDGKQAFFSCDSTNWYGVNVNMVTNWFSNN